MYLFDCEFTAQNFEANVGFCTICVGICEHLLVESYCVLSWMFIWLRIADNYWTNDLGHYVDATVHYLDGAISSDFMAKPAISLRA